MRRRQFVSVLKFAICYSLFVIPLGCSGTAKINFISMNTNAIDPPSVEPVRFDAQRCHWWSDDHGDFNIAMQCKKAHLLLGPLGDVEIDLSLVLSGPPAGSGRDYAIKQREARVILISPAGNQRFVIHAGICSVLTGSDGTYQGHYRLWATSLTEMNVFSFIPQRNGPVLCFGSFHAVSDEKRGRPIRLRSEIGGWMRPLPVQRPATSQPTTAPTAAR